MLQISNVSKSFGDNLILGKVSFSVDAGERVGLIGPNGCGKTTLLKIITGELEPDTGSAWLSPAGLRLGYLAQALEYRAGETVGPLLKEAMDGLAAAERQLDQLSQQMAAAQGEALERLQTAWAAV